MLSLDPPERNRAWAEAETPGFPVLSDPEGETATAYGVLGRGGSFSRRVTFFVDAEGVIRGVDENVSPSRHGNDVAKRLEALGFPKRKTP